MPFGSRAPGIANCLCLLIPLSCLACAQAPGKSPVAWDESRQLHGIPVRIVVRHPDESVARAAIDAGFAAADSVGAKLLASRPGSEIDILAKVPSRLWVEISGTTYAALTLAVRIAAVTDGAYDPTWPALLRVWGLRVGGTPRVPRDFEIDMALRRVDSTDLEISDADGARVRRLSRRTEIDLGGLARGAMLDGAAERLRALGVAAASVGTADEHVCFGGSEAHPWQIALAVAGPRATATLHGGAVASASRGAPIETPSGQTIHSRFDPRSGRPASGSRWVVVSAANAAASAAYAEALFAMGADARGWLETHETHETKEELRAAIAPEVGAVWVSSPRLSIRLER